MNHDEDGLNKEGNNAGSVGYSSKNMVSGVLDEMLRVAYDVESEGRGIRMVIIDQCDAES